VDADKPGLETGKLRDYSHLRIMKQYAESINIRTLNPRETRGYDAKPLQTKSN
jgi:hypothetical protein